MLFNPRLVLLLLPLTIAVLACNFSSGSKPDSPTAVSTLIAFATASPTGSTASSSTATMTPSATATRASSASSNTTASSQSSTVNVYVVDLPAPFPVCSVSATGNFAVNIRNSNNANATIIGSLKTASWIKVDYHHEGWFRIDYPGTPVDNMWISDDPVTLTQPCQCTPDCLPVPPPNPTLYAGPHSDCRVDYSRPDPMSIYVLPTESSAVMSTLTQGEFSFAFSQRDNWYKIYVPELSAYGWVPLGVLDMWTGAPCSTLPVEAMPATAECIVVNTSGQNVGAYHSPDDASFALRFPAGMSAIGLEKQGEWIKVRMEQGKWPDDGEFWVTAASFSTEGPCNFSN